jgi:hypothetical protein
MASGQLAAAVRSSRNVRLDSVPPTAEPGFGSRCAPPQSSAPDRAHMDLLSLAEPPDGAVPPTTECHTVKLLAGLTALRVLELENAAARSTRQLCVPPASRISEAGRIISCLQSAELRRAPSWLS